MKGKQESTRLLWEGIYSGRKAVGVHRKVGGLLWGISHETDSGSVKGIGPSSDCLGEGDGAAA